MPQVNGLGQVSSTPGDNLQAVLMDAMVRKQMQDSINQTNVLTQGTFGQKGAQDVLTHGTFGQNAAHDTAMQQGKFAGEQGLLQTQNTGAENLANIGAKSALDVTGLQGANQANVARITSGPQQTLADLEKTRYEQDPKLMIQRTLANQLNQGLGGGQPGGVPGAVPAPSGPMFAPQDYKDLARGMFGLGEDPQTAMIRPILQSVAASGNITPDQLPQFIQAIQSRDYSKLPQMQMRGNPAAINEAAKINEIAAPDLQQIDNLVGHNNWIFTGNNKDQLVGMINNLAQRLQQQGFSPAAIQQLRREIAARVQNKFNEAKTFNALGSTDAVSSIQP